MPNIQRIGSASARGFGFGKTGAVYFKNITETASGVDSTALIVGNALTVQETASVADATSVLVNYINNVVSETASGSDVVSSAPVYIATTLETASGADSISTLATNNVSATETSTISDSPSSIGTFNISATETATGADSINSTRVSTASVSEVVIGFDEVFNLRTVRTSIAETASGADTTNSEIGVSYWISNYAYATTSYAETGYSSTVDSDDNIYVVGSGNTAGVTSAVLLYKYNSNGVMQWNRLISDTTDVSSEDIGFGVSVDSSQNVYVTGVFNLSNVYIAGYRRVMLLKFDSSGNKLYEKGFRNTTTSVTSTGYDIVLDSSGNIYTTGNMGAQLLLVKYDNSGTIQWIYILANEASSLGSSVGRTIRINSSGNLVISGQKGIVGPSTGIAYEIPFIAIFDTAGNLLSQKRLVRTIGTLGTEDSEAYSMTLDVSDNIYQTGYVGQGVSSVNFDVNGPYVVKYDSSGNFVWGKAFQNSTTAGNYPASGVVVDNAGNIYFTYTDRYINNSYIIVKLNSSGVIQWSNQISATGLFGLNVNPQYYRNVLYLNSDDDLIFVGVMVDSPVQYVPISTFTFKIPKDGSKLGTYTVGPWGQPITYASVSLTTYTLSWTTTNASGSVSTPTYTAPAEADVIAYTPPETATTVYI